MKETTQEAISLSTKNLETLPWKLLINTNAIALTLQSHHLSSPQIDTLHLSIFNGFGRFKGNYIHLLKRIYIDLQAHAKDFRYASRQIENVFQQEEANIAHIHNYFVTNRLETYLKQAPEIRARDFSKKLLKKAAERRINASVNHELSHVIDKNTKGFIENIIPELSLFGISYTIGYLGTISYMKLTTSVAGQSISFSELTQSPASYLALVTGFFTGTQISYWLSPAERRANEFAENSIRNKEFGNIITILD